MPATAISLTPGFIKRGPSQFDDPSQSLTVDMLAFTRRPPTTATQRPLSGRYLRFSDRGIASPHLDARERGRGATLTTQHAEAEAETESHQQKYL
jgi:hypothetical protein